MDLKLGYHNICISIKNAIYYHKLNYNIMIFFMDITHTHRTVVSLGIPVHGVTTILKYNVFSKERFYSIIKRLRFKIINL